MAPPVGPVFGEQQQDTETPVWPASGKSASTAHTEKRGARAEVINATYVLLCLHLAVQLMSPHTRLKWKKIADAFATLVKS